MTVIALDAQAPRRLEASQALRRAHDLRALIGARMRKEESGALAPLIDQGRFASRLGARALKDIAPEALIGAPSGGTEALHPAAYIALAPTGDRALGLEGLRDDAGVAWLCDEVLSLVNGAQLRALRAALGSDPREAALRWGEPAQGGPPIEGDAVASVEGYAEDLAARIQAQGRLCLCAWARDLPLLLRLALEAAAPDLLDASAEAPPQEEAAARAALTMRIAKDRVGAINRA